MISRILVRPRWVAESEIETTSHVVISIRDRPPHGQFAKFRPSRWRRDILPLMFMDFDPPRMAFPC